MRHPIIALAAALLMLAAPPAFACSIAVFTVVKGLGTAEEPVRSPDGEFMLFIDDSSGEGAPVVVVTDADGNEVPGTQADNDLGYRVWTPDEALAAGTYTITLDQASNVNGETTGVLQVTGEEVSAPALDMVELSWTERASSEKNCCARSLDDTCQFDTCGGYDGCEVCWSVRYDYHPTLKPSFSNAPSAYLIRTTVTAGSEYTNTTLGTGAPDVAPPFVETAADAEGPFCLTAEFLDADGNSIGATEERCFELSEFGEPETREIDNSSKLSECVDTPDDPEDPNWVDYDEKPPGTKGSGGCSTVAGGDAGLFALLLGFVGFLRKRR